jgi:hypothetical protein
MGDLSGEIPSQSDTSSRQLSVADLKAARLKAAALQPHPHASSDMQAPPASPTRDSRPANQTSLPRQRVNDLLSRIDKDAPQQDDGLWDPNQLLKVLGVGLTLFVLWLVFTFSINVYVPALAVTAGVAIGILTQRIMGGTFAIGVLAGALTLSISCGVLLLAVVAGVRVDARYNPTPMIAWGSLLAFAGGCRR